MRAIAFLIAGWLGFVSAAEAADLNCKYIRLIVPYAAGGATDVAARLVAKGLEEALGKSVVVETRAGASGNIGTLAVIAADPDGCTLLINGAMIATFPYSFSKLDYDPIKDLVTVGGVGISPTVLVTSRKDVTDVKSLLAKAKESSDGLSYASAGYGLLQHLAIEELASRTGSKLGHIPYRGGGQATTDLVTGRIDFGSVAIGSVIPMIKEGKLKALAVVQDKRTSLAPDTATAAEQGQSGLNAGVHFMIFAPAKTSKDIVNELSKALKSVVSDPKLESRFADIGFEPTPISSEEAGQIVRKTGDDWAPIIKRLGIKLD
jgi:tripartite-type tricarboxylate transporter receptor subunit TctC